MSEQVEMNKIITLISDSGEEEDFEVIEMLEVDSKMYAILQPIGEATEEALVLRVEKDENGEDSLVTVDDDEEWEKVAEEFDTIMFEKMGGSDDDLEN